MQKFITQKNDKATVCAKGTCVTVYGDTAKLVNIAIIVAFIIFIAGLVSKALK